MTPVCVQSARNSRWLNNADHIYHEYATVREVGKSKTLLYGDFCPQSPPQWSDYIVNTSKPFSLILFTWLSRSHHYLSSGVIRSFKWSCKQHKVMCLFAQIKLYNEISPVSSDVFVHIYPLSWFIFFLTFEPLYTCLNKKQKEAKNISERKRTINRNKYK